MLGAALVVGALGLWAAARDQGAREAARDAAPPVARTSQVTTTQPATVVVATTVAASAEPVLATTIEASGQAGNSKNSCGEVITYEPARAQDGDPATTWRVKGDGTGQTLVLTLAGPTRLTEVGLLPGYARIDPCNGADRFPQLRRVTKVRWLFDGGAVVEQAFVEEPRIQMMPVDVTTSRVTIEIAGVTPKAQIDYTPISEVRLVGVPAVPRSP